MIVRFDWIICQAKLLITSVTVGSCDDFPDIFSLQGRQNTYMEDYIHTILLVFIKFTDIGERKIKLKRKKIVWACGIIYTEMQKHTLCGNFSIISIKSIFSGFSESRTEYFDSYATHPKVPQKIYFETKINTLVHHITHNTLNISRKQVFE